jgi:pyridoxamine 5'-phosphate oxidase
MKFADCIEFANKNPIAWMATAEGDQPRVRALGMWYADETGFFFQIGGTKDLYRQLQENPRVEFAFYEADEMSGTMLRVNGKVEFLEDPEMKKKVLDDRPFLKEFGLTPESPMLIIFKVASGEAHFWNFETNMEPKKIIKFGD